MNEDHRLITVFGKPFCNACGMGDTMLDLTAPCLMGGIEYNPEPATEQNEHGETVEIYG
jgi:hypothetical protein